MVISKVDMDSPKKSSFNIRGRSFLFSRTKRIVPKITKFIVYFYSESRAVSFTKIFAPSDRIFWEFVANDLPAIFQKIIFGDIPLTPKTIYIIEVCPHTSVKCPLLLKKFKYSFRILFIENLSCLSIFSSDS